MLSGGPAPAPRHATIVDALVASSLSGGGVTFVDGLERETRLPWRVIASRARRAATALVARGVRPGDRVALILRTGSEFLDAFFGAMIAGAVPVPLYPPVRLAHLDRYRVATARMLSVVGAQLVVADRTLRALVAEAALEARPPLGLVGDDELDALDGDVPASADPDALAMIQFSSGTTVDPRPVAIGHRELAWHLESLMSVVTPDPPIGVSWLPLYHDMGLIGCLLGAAFVGGDLVLIPPEAFIARPALWLRAIGRHRAGISPAPSFAYALAARRIRDDEMDGVDLSSWRLALDGAEPVSPAAAQRFAARFARWGFDPRAIVPVYGLAEATLAVTYAPPGRALQARRIRAQEVVSVGRPFPGVEVAIRDGRIAVRGPSVMRGYFGMTRATQAVLRDGWLDTGDLGEIHGGELYVHGRAKDVVIVRGANHHPQELEAPVDGIPGIRAGCVVAVSFMPPGGDAEELLILAEHARDLDDRDGAIARVRAAVLEETGVRPHTVELVPPGSLPRTSSGKLRRGEALRRWRTGELARPARASRLGLAWRALRGQLALGRLRHGHG